MRIQNLENQITNECFFEFEAGEKFITRVKNLRDQMIAISTTITDEDLAHRCILILPPKYDGLVMAQNTQNINPPLSLEDFSVMILEEGKHGRHSLSLACLRRQLALKFVEFGVLERGHRCVRHCGR